MIGVRIKTTQGENKLFRDGDYPVLRGTALILDERNANLSTNGYLPQLDTYIGPETPNPLFITALRSKYTMPKLKTVLDDIMGLTKINYNSCNFNDGLPVTVHFANMVGDVLDHGFSKRRRPAAIQVLCLIQMTALTARSGQDGWQDGIRAREYADYPSKFPRSKQMGAVANTEFR